MHECLPVGAGTDDVLRPGQGRLPLDGNDGDTAGAPVGKWDDPALWFNALPPLVGSQAVLRAEPPGVGRAPARAGGRQHLRLSVRRVLVDYQTTYGTSPSGGGVEGQTFLCYVFNSKLLNSGDKNAKLAKLSPGSAFVILVEKRMVQGELKPSDANYSKTLSPAKADRKRFASRHHKGTGGHLLFADTHVEFASNQEVNTPNPAAGGTDYNYPDERMWDPHGAAN